ncbi:MAG: hypothetical protein ACI85O_002045 [Saprospiraceae bacterium]|jgi:hypothetical protein
MKKILLILSILISFIACNSTERTEEVVKEEYMVDLPGDFAVFYKIFHEDSLFQMSRIIWPLQGLPTTDKGENIANGKYYHSKENWLMHRRMTKDTGFNGRMKLLGEDLIEETLTDGNGQFGMQRRFSKFGEEWYLIYYSGLNHIAQEINSIAR